MWIGSCCMSWDIGNGGCMWLCVLSNQLGTERWEPSAKDCWRYQEYLRGMEGLNDRKSESIYFLLFRIPFWKFSKCANCKNIVTGTHPILVYVCVRMPACRRYRIFFRTAVIYFWLICVYRQRLNVFCEGCRRVWVCGWCVGDCWHVHVCVCVCFCVEVQVRYAGGIGRGVTRETDEERWSNTTQNALAPPPNTYLCKGIKQARKLRAMPDQN